MPLTLPNLQALVDRLPDGTLAKELVTAFAGAESIEAVRNLLRAKIDARIEEKKKELLRAEDQMA